MIHYLCIYFIKLQVQRMVSHALFRGSLKNPVVTINKTINIFLMLFLFSFNSSHFFSSWKWRFGLSRCCILGVISGDIASAIATWSRWCLLTTIARRTIRSIHRLCIEEEKKMRNINQNSEGKKQTLNLTTYRSYNVKFTFSCITW